MLRSGTLRKAIFVSMVACLSFIAVREKQTLDRTMKETQSQLASAQGRSAKQQARAARLADDAAAKDAKIHELERVAQRHAAENDAARRDLAQRDVDLQRTREEVAALRVQIQRQAITLQGASNELIQLRQANENAQSLLIRRTEELSTAKAFLSTSDGVSPVDVKEMVERINTEIFQLSANIADELASWLVKVTVTTDAEQTLSPEVGTPLAALLCSSARDDFEYTFQCALQAILCQSCEKISRSWMQEDEGGLEQTMDCVMRFESPVVARKWRSIARTCITAAADPEQQQAKEVEGVTVSLLKLLRCLGFENDWACNALGPSIPAIGTIVKLASRVKKAMGEEVVSADLVLLYIAPTREHDSELVENGDGKTMICTTDLGLMGMKRGDRGVERRVLLKARGMWN